MKTRGSGFVDVLFSCDVYLDVYLTAVVLVQFGVALSAQLTRAKLIIQDIMSFKALADLWQEPVNYSNITRSVGQSVTSVNKKKKKWNRDLTISKSHDNTLIKSMARYKKKKDE